MICNSCESVLFDGAKFCANCGVEIVSISQPVQELSNNTKPSFIRSAYDSASRSVKNAASDAKNISGLVATQIGDLNGDGKVDAEDFKIAVARAKQLSISAAQEAKTHVSEAFQSDLGKDVKNFAVIGAVIAVPLPGVGPIVGGTVGALVGVYKNINK